MLETSYQGFLVAISSSLGSVNWNLNPNQQALGIYTAHRPALIQCARSLLKDDSQSEDLVQEAWVRFEAKMSSKAVRSPVPYLYRIVRNLAYDALRRKQQEVPILSIDTGDTDGFLAASPHPSPDQELTARDEMVAVQKALAELPERTRRALELRRFEKMRLQEIADELGVSITRAHELIVEGVEHCRARVRPHEFEES